MCSGRAPLDPHVQSDRNGAAVRQRHERRGQSAFGENCRVAGQFAQLIESRGRLGRRLIELRGELIGAGRHRALDGLETERETGQALPGTIVQIPLDAPSRLVGGGDDPRARRGELGIQLGVVKRDSQLAGDEFERVEPFGGERATHKAVSSSSSACRVPRLRTGRASSEQQATSAEYGSSAKRSSLVASRTTSGSPIPWAQRSTDIGPCVRFR